MNEIPETRKYTTWHMWIEMEDEFIGRCGITDRYLESIDIIEFVEFPDIDWEVRIGEKIGLLESEKAFFDIKTPVSGRIIQINRELETDPTLINGDPFGNGWIYKIDVKEPNEFYKLMDDNQYADFIENGGDI